MTEPTQSTARRAVIYARVSSQGQRDRQTIESQLRVLPEFVESRGWELVRPTDTYIDDGFSAKAGGLDDLKGRAQLLSDAEAGLFDLVAVVDQDRLTRSEDLVERGYILGSLQRAQIQIAVQSTGQVLDLSSSEGDLHASLQGFFSAEENRKRRKRTLDGKQTAIKRGRKPSGPTPYGYNYDRTTGTWTIDQDQGAIVRELFERVAGGESCHSLARELNERGVPRPRSGAWQQARVNQIVRQRAYIGTYTADKKRNLTIEVPRIVSDWLFEQAEIALQANRFHLNPKTNHYNLAQGIGVCGVCGQDILLTGNKLKKRYYVCRSKKGLGKDVERCPNPMRQVEPTDEKIWAQVRYVLEQPDLLEGAVQLRIDRANETDWEAELKETESKLAAIDRRAQNVLNSYMKGLIADDVYEQHLVSTQRDREGLERQRDLANQNLLAAKRTEQETRALRATVEKLKQNLDTASPEERQKLVRMLIPGRDGYRITFEQDGTLTIMGMVDAGTPASNKAGSGEGEGGSGVFHDDGVSTSCDRRSG